MDGRRQSPEVFFFQASFFCFSLLNLMVGIDSGFRVKDGPDWSHWKNKMT
jgi:hypothetical protein